jgi:hypothetical protein
MKTTQTTVEQLINFVNQKPGIDPANYYSDWRDTDGIKAYRKESREITADRNDFFELLALANVRLGDSLESKLKFNLEKSSGRLTLKDGRLEYCTGQYFPTEYRPAANRILSQLIWNDYNSEQLPNEPNPVYKDGHAIRKVLKYKVSRRVMKNYFN